jgi:hypothetical protein
MARKHRDAVSPTISPMTSDPSPTVSPLVSNLAACIEDVRQAILDNTPGPYDPTYEALLSRMLIAQYPLPALYLQATVCPFYLTLLGLGPLGYQWILLQDPARSGTGGLMADISQAVLQHGDGYESVATGAFQELVSDLYDGFLSAENRRGLQPPDFAKVAPLVKWGNPLAGPYTLPIDSTRVFGVGAAVVSLPPAHARCGLLGWAALGHETCGHDILHADFGLEGELAEAVAQALLAAGIGDGLPQYWSARVDETASDVQGILNMGPAAAVGVLSYLRALNAVVSGQAILRCQAVAGDPHPVDILRGFLAAATVGLLHFDGAEAWSDLLWQEAEKDLTQIVLGGQVVDADTARRSAIIVAATLFATKTKSLEYHSLGDIQNWRNADEERVSLLRPLLASGTPLPQEMAEGMYAAHVVAAASMEALSTQTPLSTLFANMLAMLNLMRAHNPVWGPLPVRHRGDVARRQVWRPDLVR